jgi:hypothetical protein
VVPAGQLVRVLPVVMVAEEVLVEVPVVSVVLAELVVLQVLQVLQALQVQ